jgi:hypothetical protein
MEMALIFKDMDEQYKAFYYHANHNRRNEPMAQVPDVLWEEYQAAKDALEQVEIKLAEYFP